MPRSLSLRFFNPTGTHFNCIDGVTTMLAYRDPSVYPTLFPGRWTTPQAINVFPACPIEGEYFNGFNVSITCENGDIGDIFVSIDSPVGPIFSTPMTLEQCDPLLITGTLATVDSTIDLEITGLGDGCGYPNMSICCMSNGEGDGDWTFSFGGVVDNNCDDCELLNDTYTLSAIGNCMWTLNTGIPACPDGSSTWSWQLVCSDSRYVLSLFAGASFMLSYELIRLYWNPSGPNTMAFLGVSQPLQTHCVNWPTHVTLTR